jgi:mono/diheme cytochrome c family protein
MRVRLSALVFSIALLAGCDTGPKSSMGFTLPDGDEAAGQAVFVAMNCSSCHSISGMPELREGLEPEMSIALGGDTTRIKTYGELVTSIINPSHKLARSYPADMVSDDGVSKMRNYNDAMTVSELIDLVAFVQGQYDLHIPYRSTYPPY